eukprot:11552589-Ditylum_brightwellii.AAC.1
MQRRKSIVNLMTREKNSEEPVLQNTVEGMYTPPSINTITSEKEREKVNKICSVKKYLKENMIK